MASLEQNFGRLRDAARADHEQHDRDIDELKKALAAERAAREALKREHARGLEENLAGDLHLERTSVAWVLLGLTAATVPALVMATFCWLYRFSLPFGCQIGT